MYYCLFYQFYEFLDKWFRFTLTVKQCGIVCAPINWEVVAPRVGIVQTPEVDADDILVAANQHAVEVNLELFQFESFLF